MIPWKKSQADSPVQKGTAYLVYNGAYITVAYPSEFTDGGWTGEYGPVETVSHYAEINLPGQESQEDANLKHLNAIEKAFPGKDCSIEFRKWQGIRRDVTIRVDDCYARREFDTFMASRFKEGTDVWMEYELEHMIHLVQGEFEKLKKPGRDWSKT